MYCDITLQNNGSPQIDIIFNQKTSFPNLIMACSEHQNTLSNYLATISKLWLKSVPNFPAQVFSFRRRLVTQLRSPQQSKIIDDPNLKVIWSLMIYDRLAIVRWLKIPGYIQVTYLVCYGNPRSPIILIPKIPLTYLRWKEKKMIGERWKKRKASDYRDWVEETKSLLQIILSTKFWELGLRIEVEKILEKYLIDFSSF